MRLTSRKYYAGGLAIVVAFIFPAGSIALFLSVSAMWFIPDRRIEHVIKTPGTD